MIQVTVLSLLCWVALSPHGNQVADAIHGASLASTIICGSVNVHPESLQKALTTFSNPFLQAHPPQRWDPHVKSLSTGIRLSQRMWLSSQLHQFPKMMMLPDNTKCHLNTEPRLVHHSFNWLRPTQCTLQPSSGDFFFKRPPRGPICILPVLVSTPVLSLIDHDNSSLLSPLWPRFPNQVFFQLVKTQEAIESA